jgi:prepilin-type N-terminal cleavage/methylation domain-containing protein
MCRNKGFSLLEILIALAILIVGVAAVINMFPIGLHASKRAADFTSAGILAQEKMAELMYLGYDHIDKGTSPLIHPNITGIPDNMGTTKQPFPGLDNQYSWHLDLDDTTTANLAKATLWIYWNDRGNETNETFITYIANRN